MARMKLTAAAVKAAKPGMLNDGGGLYLHVATGKSWVFRFVSPTTKRTRDMGLGPLDDMTLAVARDKLVALRALVRDGIDPIEQRRDARAARSGEAVRAAKVMTFDQCAEATIAYQRPSWSEHGGSEQDWRASLTTYAFPVLGTMAVGAIDTVDVLKVIEPIWPSPTAKRLLARIEKVLDRAGALKLRHGDNPARWNGHLEYLLTRAASDEVEHHKALPYADLPGFMAKLRATDSLTARALEFCILTNARPGEVIRNNHGKPPMAWGEIDLEAQTWTVPGAGPRKHKSGHIWRVPLSERAVEILAELRPVGVDPAMPVFAGVAIKAPLKLLRILAGDFEVTVHGSDRSTFSDWAADEHGAAFPEEVRKLAVGHWCGDKTDQAYRRGDGLAKRRRLAQMWADFCAGQPEAKIVELRRFA